MKITYLLLSISLLTSANAGAQLTLQWARGLGSTTGDIGYSIARDASGNLILTGYFNGTVDFDPGPGVTNRTAPGVMMLSLQNILPQEIFYGHMLLEPLTQISAKR